MRKIKIVLLVFAVVIIIVGIVYYPQYKDSLKWKKYFARTSLEKPNDLVAKSINTKTYQNPSKIVVLDLGAGNGNETSYLLNQRFKVYAIDFHQTALERIMQRGDTFSRERLTLIKSSFQDIKWHNLPQFDAVIAINSISFVNLNEFKVLLHNIS